MSADSVRRLRLVPRDDAAPVVTQIAGMPDAYRVRRSGPAAALMARSRGTWVVLFGHDQQGQHAVGGWTRQAVIAGSHDERSAGVIALALADAYESNVPAYLDLMCAAVDSGVAALVDLLRLHRPDYSNACEGEPDNPQPWRRCPTARIIAGSLSVDLPD